MPKSLPPDDRVSRCAIGIDPGVVHGTGYVIVKRDALNGHVWVVKADKRYGTEISEDAFKRMVADDYRDYCADIIRCESNSGGLEWVLHWQSIGLHAFTDNFGTAVESSGEVANQAKAVERHYKERVFKDLMERRMIHCCPSKELIKELSLYNPYENKEKGKGDIVDALLHAVYEVVGRYHYIQEHILVQEREKDTKGGYTA